MRYKYNHYGVPSGVKRLKTKLTIGLSTIALLIGGSGGASLFIQSTAHALSPNWNTNGNYTFDFEYLGGHYVHDATISGQTAGGNYTINGGYPAGGPHTYVWNGTGNVTGSTVTNSVNYTVGAPGTHMDMTGTIASNGTMSGTWSDNYGGTRTGTWTTASGAAIMVSPVSNIIVTPANTQGWTTADTRPGGAVNFKTDSSAPGTPHTGALQLTSDATTTAKAQYLHSASTYLTSVTALSYSTKQNAGTAFTGGAASYQLPVCLGGVTGTTCNGFTTFVYEPYENGTVSPGVWQSWDVAAGQFWSSRTTTDGAACSVVAGGGGAPFYTLAALKAVCPNALVVGYGVNIGSYNPSYNVETDQFNFNNTTFNFEPISQPTKEKDCKNDGWKNFNAPTFSSQKACERWLDARAHGKLLMSNPSQKIIFSVANSTGHDGNDDHEGKRKNTVEYWNYTYPGGLHYSADVLCANVDPATKEARFMYQIPEGFPGLSGLYVVSYVKDVGNHQPDLYGHNSTSDKDTATQWCQTGVGFVPSMYPVTKGNVEIED